MRESEKSAPRAQSPSRPFPAPALAAIPLLQHAGAPCKPLVKPGERVYLGQKIGAPDGFVSAAVHCVGFGQGSRASSRASSPVGRRVAAVILENDGLDEWDPSLAPLPEDAGAEKLLEAVRRGGHCRPWAGRRSPPTSSSRRPKDKPIDHGHPQRRGVRTLPQRRPPRDARGSGRRAGRPAPRGEDRRRPNAAHRRGGQQARRRHEPASSRGGGRARFERARQVPRRAAKSSSSRRSPAAACPRAACRWTRAAW